MDYYTRQPYVEGAFSYIIPAARAQNTTAAAPILIQNSMDSDPGLSVAEDGGYGAIPRPGVAADAVSRPRAGPHLMQ